MSLNMIDVQRAQAFSVAAHCAVGQKRKYTGIDYYHHPFEVAQLIRDHALVFNMDMIVAALLHDVVEDTQVTGGQVREVFGPVVAKLVAEVTDVSTPADGSRESRKSLDRLHLAKASAEGQTIKLADLICNCRDIVQHDSKFASIYMREKRLLLGVLNRGDARLYEMAFGLVQSYFAEAG